MHLLTWHGTIVCQPDQTGIFVHHPLRSGRSADALSLDLPQGEGTIRHHEMGTLQVRRGARESTVLLTRDGLFACAEGGTGKFVFDRTAAAAWETFLPIGSQTLADLEHILAYRWIVRSTRCVVQRRTIGLAEDFRLHLGAFAIDLAESLDRLVSARGLNGLPTALSVPHRGDAVELVVAEPRSSALVETAAWPVRSRRVAEIITFAVHRQLDGTEPTQDVFERDVAYLQAHGGPAALEDFLEELSLSAAIERRPGAGARQQGAPSIEIEARLAEAQTHVEAARSLAAQDAFERIAEDYPDDPRAVFRLGDLLHAAGDYTACFAAWERCLEIAPKYTEAVARLAYMAGSLDRPLDAIARLEAALALEPEAVEKRVFLAIRYAEMRWLDRAAATFAAIKEKLRSWMEASRRDTEKNLAHQKELLTRLAGAQDWDQRLQRARCAFALGELDLCAAAIDELLAQGGQRPEPHMLRAEMLVRTASLDAAMDYLDKRAGSFGADADFIVFRARLDYAAENYERAESALAKLVAETPRGDAFRLLALTALCLEDLPALGRATRAWAAFNDRDTACGILAIAEARGSGRLVRLDDLEAGVLDIPYPVIVQFWDSAEVPPDVAQAMATWPAKNPGMGHLVFNDASARAFLAEHCPPEVLQCYDAAHHPAMQSDIFRLAYLNRRGGVYVDADDICTRDIRRVFAGLARVDVIATQSTETPPYVNNAFIAARPGCPIIAEALAEAVRGVAEHVAAGRQPDIWQVTGPGLLTRKIARFVADPAHRGRVLLLTDGEFHAFSITHDMHYKQTDAGDWRLDTASRAVTNKKPPGGAAPPASAATDDVLTAWAMREIGPWQAKPVSRSFAERLYESLNHDYPWIGVYRFAGGDVTLDPKPAGVVLTDFLSVRAQYYLDFFRSIADRLPPGFRTTLCMGHGDALPKQYEAPVFCFQKEAHWHNVLLPDIDFLAGRFYEQAENQDSLPYEAKERGAVFAGSTSGGLVTPDVARNLSLPRLRAAGYFAGSESVDFRLPGICQCSNAEAEAILRGYDFCKRPALSWQEQFRRRLLISMDGNGATCSRVAIALHSQCVLLKYDSSRVLYYFGGLQPWLHYVPVREDADIERIVAQEARDPARFARIAANGRDFAQTYLSKESVLRYTALLLTLYADSFSDAPETRQTPAAAEKPKALPQTSSGYVVAHIENVGDRASPLEDWVGEPGSGRAIEGLAIVLGSGVPTQGFTYSVVLRDGSLSEACRSGDYCGTRGRAVPIYGVCIQTGEGFDVTYETRFVDGTAIGPVRAGTICAAPSGKALEAVRLAIKVK